MGDAEGKRNRVRSEPGFPPQSRQGSRRLDIRREWKRSGPDWKDAPGHQVPSGAGGPQAVVLPKPHVPRQLPRAGSRPDAPWIGLQYRSAVGTQ